MPRIDAIAADHSAASAQSASFMPSFSDHALRCASSSACLAFASASGLHRAPTTIHAAQVFKAAPYREPGPGRKTALSTYHRS